MQFARGAWRLAAVPGILAVPATLLSPIVGGGLVVVAVAVLLTHRDPDRTTPATGIVAPADGRVTVLRAEPAASVGAPPRVRVGVFMQVTDVHVNRAPLPGTVKTVTHDPGGHWPAFSKSADRNERVTIACDDYELTLIAGALARRIHPYVEAGETIARGQRIGHISFGSRADVLLPVGVGIEDVHVSVGDRVRAGETVIAEG